MLTRSRYYLSFLLLSLCCYQQAAIANYLNKPQLIQSVLNEMVFIPGGSFMMGTNNPKYIDSTGDNTPAHRVILSSFYFSKYLTSFHQFNGYYVINHLSKKIANKRAFFLHHQYPVTASWQTANKYCHWLAQQTGLPFTLSTEAQWEYTARNGGKNVVYATNNGKIKPGINFPTEKNFIYKIVETIPMKINQFPVNKLGIHQMGGNITEWVKDWYSPVYYQHSPLHNPQGPDQAQAKIQNGSQRNQSGLCAADDDHLYRVIRGLGGRGISTSMTGWLMFNNYIRACAGPNNGSKMAFRCVINSDLPLQQLKQIAARQLAKNQKRSTH